MTKTGATVEEVKDEEVKEVKPAEESKEPAAPAKPTPSTITATPAQPSAAAATSDPIMANPLKPRTDIEVDKSISTYNGGTTQKYKWSQQTMNVDVQVKLPPGTAARSIICTIKTKHLKVLIKGQEEPIIDGEL